MSRRDRSIVASVADADEAGNPIEGTDRYASSVAPSSPAKEQPNTSRARNKTRRDSTSPITTSVVTDSDSTVHPRRDALKKPSKDREKSVSKKALMAPSRPPVKHAKTTTGIPRREGESVYYGVDPALAPTTSRPRAQTSRPSSLYGPSRPPIANARFYASQTPAPSMPTSFPPPSWVGPGPGPGPGPMPPYGPPSPAPVIMQQPPLPPPDYFTRPLESRFGATRPQSSMGFRPPRAAIEYEGYDEPLERTVARRPSTTRKVSKNEEDRKAMPPPRRPASARPTELAFRPPPSTPIKRTVGFEDRDPEVDEPLFRDLSPLAPGSYDYPMPMPIPFRPRPSFGATDVTFDVHDFRTEVAGKGHRRHSYYGGHSTSSGSAYEEKMRQAARYQDDVTGGPPLPLTAESLRKAGRNGSSSRSTRSSGSHDESDYRQSATTRTTRSSAPHNDEDVTIRVKGSTVLKFGNAEMQCQDGAEINIISRGGNTDIRATSDKSSFVDQDDRRTRIDIPTGRARATSRARSYSRNFSTYDADVDYDPYDYTRPLPPPYPAYPSSYSSRPEDGYFHGPL